MVIWQKSNGSHFNLTWTEGGREKQKEAHGGRERNRESEKGKEWSKRLHRFLILKGRIPVVSAQNPQYCTIGSISLLKFHVCLFVSKKMPNNDAMLLLLLLLLAYIALPFAQRLAFRCALQF